LSGESRFDEDGEEVSLLDRSRDADWVGDSGMPGIGLRPTLATSFLERSGRLVELPTVLYASGDRERRGGLLGGGME
jgi:hypothetical protein